MNTCLFFFCKTTSYEKIIFYIGVTNVKPNVKISLLF